MTFRLPSYLRSRRRSWALTQQELALLLGFDNRSAVSKYETLARTPTPEALVGIGFIFSEQAHELFPALGFPAIRTVRANAIALREELAHRRDALAERKRQLIDDLDRNRGGKR